MDEATMSTEHRRPGRPRKPSVPVTETAEFKQALAEGIKQATSEILSQVQKVASVPVGDLPQGGEKNFAEMLAMSIAQLTDQGTGRQRVAPEIIRARTEARDRMRQLIMKAHAEGRAATYQLRNKVMLDNRVIEPMWIDSQHVTRPTEIDWPGVPNEVMLPINETAKEIHAAFMESIGSRTKEGVVDEVLGITPGGLVVRNSAVNTTAARRSAFPADAEIKSHPAPMVTAPDELGVRVHHASQPGRTKPVNILGSIHPPAQQTI